MSLKLLLCLLVAVIGAVQGAKNVKGNSVPNIVLFLVDDVSELGTSITLITLLDGIR